MKFDGKVLSFEAVWDDKSFGGELNRYKLNYHLSDDTIDVKEIHENNDGKNPFPNLLRRGKLPKTPHMIHCPGMVKKKEEFYEPKDLILGSFIKVYNRDFELIDCDEKTREFYI